MASPARSAEHLAVDPNVRIPRAVKRASAAADKKFQEVYKPEATEEPKPAEAAPPPEEAITIVEAAAPEPAKQPEPVPTPAPEPVTQPSNQPTPDNTDWKHRYESMKGRFDGAQQQMRAMGDRIVQLEGFVTQLQQQSQPAPQPASNTAAPVEVIITPEEEETYGPEFLKMVEKVAKRSMQPLLNQVKQVQQKVDGVDTHLTQDARARMYGYLDDNLPNWAEINNNGEFKSWLALPDTYSSAIRLDLLRQAYERNDGPRVLAFFKGFLAEEAAPAQAVVVQGEPQAQPAPAAKVNLVELAAPGRAKSPAASTSAPVEKPIITHAQIARFYADVRANKYAGREAEKDRLEKMIFEAQRDGRIR